MADRRDRTRPGALVSEACRDVISGTSRALAVTVLLTVLVLGAVLGDAADVAASVAAAERYRDAGAATSVLVAPGQVDGAACERLGSVAGVEAVGALRRTDADLTLTRLPSAPLPVHEATTGLLDQLGTLPGGTTGLWVSDRAAESIAATPGSTVHTADGEATVDGVFVYPDDGRRPALGYAVVVPTPATGAFDECWLAVWPPNPQTRALLWSALARLPVSAAGSREAEASITQLNVTHGEHYMVVEEHLGRTTRFLAPGAALLAVVLGLVVLRSRRVELAAQRRLGLSLPTQLARVLLESTVPLAATSVAVVGVAVVLGEVPGTGLGHPDVALVASAARVAVLGAGSFAVGVVAGVLSIRPGRLHVYLKDR